MAGRQRFGNLTRNERYRRRLLDTSNEVPDFVTFQMDFEDGTNGGTDATDQSANSHPITYVADAILTNAIVKFGSLALETDGINPAGHIEIDETADGGSGITGPTDFGSSDFTIECWVNQDAAGGAQQIFRGEPSGEFHIGIRVVAGQLAYEYSEDGTGYVTVSSGATLGADVWEHVALVRNGNTLTIYLEGTAAPTTVDFTGITLHPLTTAGRFRVGGTTTFGLNGFIDSFRIVKGQAIYTTDFQPPTSPFPIP